MIFAIMIAMMIAIAIAIMIATMIMRRVIIGPHLAFRGLGTPPRFGAIPPVLAVDELPLPLPDHTAAENNAGVRHGEHGDAPKFFVPVAEFAGRGTNLRGEFDLVGGVSVNQ